MFTPSSSSLFHRKACSSHETPNYPAYSSFCCWATPSSRRILLWTLSTTKTLPFSHQLQKNKSQNMARNTLTNLKVNVNLGWILDDERSELELSVDDERVPARLALRVDVVLADRLRRRSTQTFPHSESLVSQPAKQRKSALTRVVSGLSHAGHSTKLRMKPSRMSCSFPASCSP